ncbi:MAG: ATP-dependent RecD-like DNA helicase, partial [Opitutales bacterium]|nr:ATP-dependent RecD-like DNA helicase [Opitutales bacterium]
MVDLSADEKLCGVLEKIIYRNPSNGYSVAELKFEDDSSAIVCGVMPNTQCGEFVEVTGTWVNHQKHGRQFEFTEIESKLPSDVKGIRRYLGSGLIEGIGKVYAKKIVDYFGKDTFSVLSTESVRLLEVDGIGKQRAAKIKEAWDQQFAIRDIMIFLQTYEVPNSICLRLYDMYGEHAREILETDPYRVSKEVPGIGFKTADKIARNTGIPETHFSRIEAGILYEFGEFQENGNTCVERERLVKQAQILLKISPDRIDDQIDKMLSFNQVFEIKPGILQLSVLHHAECKIASAISRIARDASWSAPKLDVERAIVWAQGREGFAFADEQIEAIRSALQVKLNILTGGPGTGKTTILRALVAILSAKHAKIMLCAPTGRAAQRLFETTGLEAKTIHRLLQYNPAEGKFAYNEDNQLDIDYLVVDESSMLDTFLAASLVQAVPSSAAVMFVGDIDQLPSVGPGNVLNDMIHSGMFTVSRLNKIFRQEGCSDIVKVAYAIRNDEVSYPCQYSNDFSQIDPKRDIHFLLSTDPQDCASKVVTLCQKYIPQWYHIDPISDIQILTPMHKGMVGTEALNHTLQDSFIDRAYGADWLQFRVGDKVIQVRNNYDKGIFNGDLGRITGILTNEKEINVQFNQESVTLARSGINDLA